VKKILKIFICSNKSK